MGKILLLGAGGHCMSVLDSLLALNLYTDIGIIDKAYKEECPHILGVPIIGDDDDLEMLHKKGYTDAFITVGSLGDISIRNKLYKIIKDIGFHIPNIIDCSCIVSKFATLGEGNYIGKNVVVNAGTNIGNCTIINTSSSVDHECIIGDFAHLSPGSILCGNVSVGANTHVGAGSVIKQGLVVGSDTMIGMGSVVLSDIRSNTRAFGNPCKEV